MQSRAELLAGLKPALPDRASRKNTPCGSEVPEVSGSQTTPQPFGSSAGVVCAGGHWDTHQPSLWSPGRPISLQGKSKKLVRCEREAAGRSFPNPKYFNETFQF